MEVGGKEFQFVRGPSPEYHDSGKLTKQKLKFGMEEILGKVNETKVSTSSSLPLPPVKAYLKRSPMDLLQVPMKRSTTDLLQVPKIEPRVSPIQSPVTSTEMDSNNCDSKG